MRHFLFEETNEGFEFIVGADDYAGALVLIEDMAWDGEFEDESNIVFICELSDMEAEMSGLDEY